MARNKITIVGAGNVGTTTAHIAATRQLADIVLIDIVAGLAEGKALDIAEAAPVQLYDCSVTGTIDWDESTGSDIVIITSGLPRRPCFGTARVIVASARTVTPGDSPDVTSSPLGVSSATTEPDLFVASISAALRPCGLPRSEYPMTASMTTSAGGSVSRRSTPMRSRMSN